MKEEEEVGQHQPNTFVQNEDLNGCISGGCFSSVGLGG